MIVRRTLSLPASATLSASPHGVATVSTKYGREPPVHRAERADVVVDDVDDDREAGGVGGVDEPGERLRAAVRVLDGRPEHAVVAPVAGAGELVERHQLDGRHAERGEAGQLADRRVERAGRRERPDVQLVQHGVGEGDAGPAVVGPREPRRVDDGRRPEHAVGLPAGRRVGELLAAVEADPVAVAVADAVGDRRSTCRRRRPEPAAASSRRARRSTADASGAHTSNRVPPATGVAPSRLTSPTASECFVRVATRTKHSDGTKTSSRWCTQRRGPRRRAIGAEGPGHPRRAVGQLVAHLVQRLDDDVGVEQEAGVVVVGRDQLGARAGGRRAVAQRRPVRRPVQLLHPRRRGVAPAFEVARRRSTPVRPRSADVARATRPA